MTTERLPRTCAGGRKHCGISTGIHEGLTFGGGTLDPNGFWSEPCAPCARRYEERHPSAGPCWPGPEEPLLPSMSELEAKFFDQGLLNLATGLRAQHRGSSDPWSYEHVAQVKAYLQHRIATWKPSLASCKAFDDAAKLIVETALAEV